MDQFLSWFTVESSMDKAAPAKLRDGSNLPCPSRAKAPLRRSRDGQFMAHILTTVRPGHSTPGPGASCHTCKSTPG